MPVTSLARDRETAEVRSSSEANTEIIFLPAVCNVGWCGRVERFRENAREEGWLGGYWSTPVISADGRLSEAGYSEFMAKGFQSKTHSEGEGEKKGEGEREKGMLGSGDVIQLVE